MQQQRERAASLRQRHTIEAVQAHYAALGRPPSYKELGERLGVCTSAASDLVKTCARLKLLTVIRRRGFRTQIRLASPLAETRTVDLEDELAARRASTETPVNDTADAPDRLAA